MTLRAYDQAAKEARRQAILETAWRLFEAMEGGLPSVSQIAAEVGLGKGTIYIYYRTKEEIFAALLRERWDPALQIMQEELCRAGHPVGTRLHAFIERFVNYVGANRALLRLDALGQEVIEHNLGPEALVAHKTLLMERMLAVSVALEEALSLPPGYGFKLITRCHAMTRGLWQSFGKPVLACAELGFPIPHFETELDEALHEYWRGALATVL